MSTWRPVDSRQLPILAAGAECFSAYFRARAGRLLRLSIPSGRFTPRTVVEALHRRKILAFDAQVVHPASLPTIRLALRQGFQNDKGQRQRFVGERATAASGAEKHYLGFALRLILTVLQAHRTDSGLAPRGAT